MGGNKRERRAERRRGDGDGAEPALVDIDDRTINTHARHVDADHPTFNAVDGRSSKSLGLLERLPDERRDRRADDRRRGAVDVEQAGDLGQVRGVGRRAELLRGL